MASQTANKGFWIFSDGLPNWHHYYNANLDKLGKVAKLLALNDVDTVRLRHRSIIKWNTTTNKWEVVYNRK
jgi:hypothetical protein